MDQRRRKKYWMKTINDSLRLAENRQTQEISCKQVIVGQIAKIGQRFVQSHQKQNFIKKKLSHKLEIIIQFKSSL